MTDVPDNHSPPGRTDLPLRRRFRFAVNVEIDPRAFAEQSLPAQEHGARNALADEIRSNLESLPGVIDVRVLPG